MSAYTYAQVRYSLAEGISWATALAEHGPHALDEAREIARELTRSCATRYVEVQIEERKGAMSSGGRIYRWSRTQGWH